MARKPKGFTARQKKRIEKMAREGRSFGDIVYALTKSYDRYAEVQQHCWSSGCLNWQGAKKMISLRLKRLPQKRMSKDERKRLIQEIQEYVDYLYYCGRDLQKKVRAARRALS